MDNKLEENFSNEENFDKNIQNVENFTQSHEIQESTKEKNDEELSQKGLPIETKGEKGSPTGSKREKGSPTGAKGEKGSPTGTKGEKGSPSGAKGEKGSPTRAKRKKGLPDGTKGEHGSPNKTKGEHGSPAGAKGLERSPAGAKGLERSPAGAKGLERSPAGAKGLDRSPASSEDSQSWYETNDIDNLDRSPESSEDPQSWYETNDIDNWTPEYPFKTGFLSSNSPKDSEDQIKEEINFLLHGDKPRINKTFTEFYQEALEEINQHPSKLLDIWDTKIEEDCVRAILDLNSSKRLELFGLHSNKSEFEACKLESQFNKSLNNGETNEILLSLISRSILLTPTYIDSKLGHRYMKRSSIFLKIRKYEESLRDARRSLNYYDKLEDLMWKSYEILGICYVERSLCEKAEYCFSMALTGLSKCDCTREEMMEATKRIEDFLKPIRGIKDRPDSNYRIYTFDQKEELPSVAEDPNKYLDCASSLVMCKTFEGYGRCLMAAKDINPGDVLIVEEAVSSALNFENRKDYCCICLRKVVSPVPCYLCSNVSFCSEKCLVKNLSLDYHSRECEILPLLYDESIGCMALLTYRIFTHFSWLRLKKYFESFEKDLIPSGSFHWMYPKTEYKSKDYCNINKLTDNGDRIKLNKWIKQALTSVYMMECLYAADYFDDCGLYSDDKLKFVLYAIKHLQQMRYNATTINEFMVPYDHPGKVDLIKFGCGIFPTISLVNYSCAPNALCYHINNVCVLRATRFIKRDEEIFCNYDANYSTLSKVYRLKYLEEDYKFTCKCRACDEVWPLYVMDERPLKFACPERDCKGIIEYLVDNTCEGCPSHGSDTKSISNLILDIKEKLKELNRSLALILNGEFQSTLLFFQQFQIFLDKNNLFRSKIFTMSQDCLKRCFLAEGNKSRR